MTTAERIKSVELWQVAVPLATPYRLSKHYGTLTHSHAAVVCITLHNGVQGWGEGDPGGLRFDGQTIEGVIEQLRTSLATLPGRSVVETLEDSKSPAGLGAASAAIDVALHDAQAKLHDCPLYRMLGTRHQAYLPSLWPTSSGSADDDLAVIRKRHKQGFGTFMLKMGERSIEQELTRLQKVFAEKPDGVKIMVDANQGWNREEARQFVQGARDYPLILIEQPLVADDLAGMAELESMSEIPVSVDESLQQVDDVDQVLAQKSADVFSIKVSKHGGLANSQTICSKIKAGNRRCLMNSMIELGITQAASLHLGCTLPHLVDCGHAYMSTLRMADDITDFASLLDDGTAYVSERPGLGIEVSREKIARWQVGECYAFA